MGALTPQILMDLESRMQVLASNEYSRLTSNLWCDLILKRRPSQARREVLTWLLSTAMIRAQGVGGNTRFEDLVSTYTEVESTDSGAALELRKNQLEDTDGNGVDLAAQWARDIGAYTAYWPQKRAAYFLKNAHTSSIFTGYDSLAYFAASHPVNPFRTSAGTYTNLLTGAAVAASGNTPYFPGACPIDDSVTVDVALQNLAKIMSYISSIRMPNGEDPRFLRPRGIICSPRLFPRAVQLTDAKFIAMAASSGGGSADVEGLIRALGFATPTKADELAGFESDTTFFVACEQISTSELGAAIYIDREPYNVQYYGVMDQAELARKRTLEWICSGRNAIAAGHPYLLFKCKGS
jgi:hypothetical protein